MKLSTFIYKSCYCSEKDCLEQCLEALTRIRKCLSITGHYCLHELKFSDKFESFIDVWLLGHVQFSSKLLTELFEFTTAETV